MTYFESSLCFRHGPKSILNDRTLTISYVSGDPYTRKYDLDLLAELKRSMHPRKRYRDHRDGCGGG